ncbi:MAG: YifB family Mg chelatase-like AAA ATPase [Clostridium sp.]|nr:YifB family Mg chelatase-like AAA ATPase [Clostridium sp.]MCM1398018.1 YifB family Mg chelatase-like AAA ATPase [Clostridium sp.]MCM1459346.1 YifB family Mg chelatase-like AAA ATPase [Bacteroides sp.]
MFHKVSSSAVMGIDGVVIHVEADVSDGLPVFSMVGCLSSSVREAGERVRTALKNSDFFLPPKRITVNLSPGNLKKYGTGFDLPIAVAILLCMGITPCDTINLDTTLMIGELGLDGMVKSVNGILPMVYDCCGLGYDTCIVPEKNAKEAALVDGVRVFGVESLRQVVDLITGIQNMEPYQVCENDTVFEERRPDFSEIKGQEYIRRGMEIAAAGFHNVLMTGAAGAGKSMIAKRLPTIMPQMTFEESVQVTKIYSINGMLNNGRGLIRERPFRSPHHTITGQALIGGGVNPRPGEVSMAHNGVLFLDELPEFNKNVLEVLRQPLEDGRVSLSRVNASYSFPSDFMLVAAMNPCPCGFYPDRRRCACTVAQIRKYQGRISGPLLDRIDMYLEVRPLKYESMFSAEEAESSRDIRERVERARLLQKKRYEGTGIYFNSQLEGSLVRNYISLEADVEHELKSHAGHAGISARGINRIIKLSRTIADLDGSEDVQKKHLREACFFRNSVNRMEGGGDDVF